MADCLQSKYIYKGKEYTLESLAKHFAEGELAKLASDGIVDISKYKKGNRKAFAKNLKGVTVKESQTVTPVEPQAPEKEIPLGTSEAGEPVSTTTTKINDSLAAILEAAEGNDVSSTIMHLDENGDFIPVETIYKGKVIQGMVNKSGEVAWDIDSLNKFNKNLNKSFEGTSGKNVKIVVTNDKGLGVIHEAITGDKLPSGAESFLDKDRNIIFINGDHASLTALVHEAAHLWLPHVKEFSPSLYNAGIEIISKEPEFQAIKKAVDEYSKLTTDKQREAYLKSNKKNLGGLEDYVKKASKLKPEERNEFVADEMLARAVEEDGTIKFTSREKETFSKWLEKTLNGITKQFGFKKATLDDVKKLTLGDLAKKVKEEIVSPAKFSEVEKTAAEIRKEKIEAVKKRQEKELETIGLSEDIGIKGEYKKAEKASTFQKLREQITNTKAIETLKSKHRQLYKDAIRKLIDSGIVKNRIAELETTPEGKKTLDDLENRQAILSAQDEYTGEVLSPEEALAENILGDIIAGTTQLPKEFGRFGGRGKAGSGLIADLYNALGESYGITGVEVRENLVDAMKANETAKEKTSKTVEDRENKLQAKLKSIEKQIADAYKMPAGKERAALIEKLGADYMKVQESIDDFELLHHRGSSGTQEFTDVSESQMVNEEGAKLYNSGLKATNEGGNLVYKIGKDKVDTPANIEEAQKEIRKSGWFKWHTWSKPSIVGKENVQAVSKMKGRVSGYKAQNYIMAKELIQKGRRFMKEFNRRNPNNKFTPESFTNYLQDALEGDNEKLNTLDGPMKNIVLTMRSNIDALSLAYMESGNLSYSDMDTYYDNLGVYVSRVFEKFNTKEPTSAIYKLTKSLKEKIQSSDSPLAQAIKARIDVSTVPPWIKKLTPEDVEAAMDGISGMVDSGYFDTEEMYRNGTAFKLQKDALTKMENKMADAQEKLLYHELAKPDAKSPEMKAWEDTKKKLTDEYNKVEEEYKYKLDNYNKRKLNMVDYQYKEITSRAEDKGSIESITNVMKWKKFSERKDIPEWYKKLIGESRDVFKNYFLTIGKMQNGHSTMMMQDEILQLGLESGMIEPQGEMITPANKNYITVGGQNSTTNASKVQYGPLNGYRMHPDLYKFMFELPLMEIDNIGWTSLKGGIFEASNWVNRLKIVYNPSSIVRNFASHFGNDLKLSGFYPEAMFLTNKLVKNGHNMFHLGMDYYGADPSKGELDNMRTYYKGLINDGARFGATTTISEQEFNRLFKDITSEKGLTEAFAHSKRYDPEAPISSIINSTFRMFKYVPKTLRTAFFLGDFLPKLTHFEVMRNSMAYKVYGENFYNLNAKQMENCNNAAARCVTQDMATPEMAGEMANIKFLGIVPKFTYEMARTRYESAKNAAGKGILENYKGIDWHGNEEANDATIAKLSRAHRLRKTLGLTHYSMTMATALTLGNTIFQKAKRLLDDEAQGILVIGNPSTHESDIVDEMIREAFTFGDDITNQQAVRNIVEPYLRTHNLYAEYNPETYTMKYWDAGRNDMYAQLNGVFRGFMYNVAPDERGIPGVSQAQRSVASESPRTARAIATVANQLSTFYGYNMMTRALIDPFFDEKKSERTFGSSYSLSSNMADYAGSVARGIVPNDINRLTNTLEAAYHSEGDFMTNTKEGLQKFFKDTYIDGIKGVAKEVNVYGIIQAKVKAEAKNMEADIVTSRKKIDSKLNMFAKNSEKYGGRNFFDLSESEKIELANTPKVKEEIGKIIDEINNKARLATKNMKVWYTTAQKFNFKNEDLNKIFNNADVTNIDLGDFKSMPTYSNQDMSENFRDIIEKSSKDIDNLDFNSLYYDKTYYINR